jgi:hypothetical protein
MTAPNGSPPKREAPLAGGATRKLQRQDRTYTDARVLQLLCIACRELAEIKAHLARIANRQEVQLELWSRS